MKQVNKVELYQVQDDVMHLEHLLEHVALLQQDIVEEYFNKYSTSKEDDRLSIAWEYNRYKVFADIVEHKIFDIRKVVQSLREKVNLD